MGLCVCLQLFFTSQQHMAHYYLCFETKAPHRWFNSLVFTIMIDDSRSDQIVIDNFEAYCSQ